MKFARTVKFAFTLLASIVCIYGVQAQEMQQQGGPQVVSPQIHDDNSVTFSVYSENAQSISVNGSWMGFGDNAEMEKNDGTTIIL